MTTTYSRLKVLLAFVVLFLISTALKAQNSELYINEFKASNTRGIKDDFSEFSDWIELYNSSITELNLDGYFITDNKNDSTKWSFPAYIMPAQSYLTVFASGKDLKSLPITWKTVVNQGDTWRYKIPNANISGWINLEYDDSAWSSGNSGFGYGDSDDNTNIANRTISVYTRKEFTIENLASITRAIFHVDYDDAFIAYINGMEIARANIGTPGTPVNWNASAIVDREARMYSGGLPEEYEIYDISSFLTEGTNVLAVEIHNVSAGSSDMSLIPFLSLGYSSYNGIPYKNEILGLPGSFLHTNFKLDAGGEFIGLYNASGAVIDSLTFFEQVADISYGRAVNDPNQWGFQVVSTPGEKNVPDFLELPEKPQFSISGGFYNGTQTLTITAQSATDKIYYTTDGTDPLANSELYTEPLTLNSTVAIRAIIINESYIPGKENTQTYFIDEEINMPFISLVTDPGNLFSNETGIYVTGTNGRRGDCDNLIRNVNQDWERPVNIEFYEPNGELAFNQGAGIKIFGGCSRTRFPQKSFALYARSIYGKGSFQYQLFPEKEINDFEAFLLRSSADDQVGTFLRDPLTQEVVTEYMDMDYQAFRPTVVFINGEYWGIHNLREKINEHYFVDNFGVDTDDLNILTGNAWEVYGNNNSYNDMINFVRYNDMVDDDNYSYIQTQIDVEQFIEYELANIYLGEVDWPGNNIKFWNADDEKHSKWRWINYDRDQCFQYWRLDVNTLALATEPNGTGWPNPQWSTLLLRSLLENDGFKNQFIQLYAYHLSTTFQSERLIHHIDSFAAMMAPEIPRHSERWGGQKDPDSQETWQKPTFENFELWESNVDTMRIFSLERPPIAIQHLIDQFSLDTTDNLSINKNLAEGGLIKLYNRTIPGNNYNGNYFSGVPIKLTATPSYGYSFSHWIATTASGSETLTTQEIEITLNGDMQLTAHFEAYNLEGPLVIINEINYNSSPDFNPGDWIELYNRHTETVDLSGWYLKDSDDSNSFFFPDGFTLEANNYIVICENTTDFDNLYTDVTNRIGNLGFKLSNGGEVIRLYAHDNILVDSVNYGDSTPWPVLADGSGPTLELKDTGLDNDMPENWAAYEFINGTPGKTNSIPESSDKILFTDNNILYQNYPNPFSGTTIIPYSLSERGFVQITVYDMMGKQIKSLVNQNQEAGTYKTEFNTGDLSNGIFIYTMHINHSPVKTRRMVVSE